MAQLGRCVQTGHVPGTSCLVSRGGATVWIDYTRGRRVSRAKSVRTRTDIPRYHHRLDPSLGARCQPGMPSADDGEAAGPCQLVGGGEGDLQEAESFRIRGWGGED